MDLMISEGTGSPQQSRAENEAPPCLGGEGSQEETLTSLHSHQLTALPNKIFTLKPWQVKKIFQFYFILST